MTIVDTFKAGIAGITGIDLTKVPNGGFETAWFEPDAVWEYGPVIALPDEPPAWQGPEAILEGWSRWLAQWDEYVLLPTSITAYSETQLDRVFPGLDLAERAGLAGRLLRRPRGGARSPQPIGSSRRRRPSNTASSVTPISASHSSACS